MKEIPLTQGYKALVDDIDYNRLNQFLWQVIIKENYSPYAYRTDRTNGKETIYMHREILQCDLKVDHRDGNGLNNQRYNLREATSQQNSFNITKRSKTTSSAYKGVCWNRQNKQWQSYIYFNKKIHLGYFEDEIDAAIAYNNKAIELFGEFAKLNII